MWKKWRISKVQSKSLITELLWRGVDALCFPVQQCRSGFIYEHRWVSNILWQAQIIRCMFVATWRACRCANHIHQPRSSSSNVWFYLRAIICVQSVKSCHLNKLLWIYVVWKGNVFCWITRLFDLVKDVWWNGASSTQAQHLAEESAHLIISSSVCLSFLSLPEEVFSAQYESLKEENEALSKIQKECTAKR